TSSLQHHSQEPLGVARSIIHGWIIRPNGRWLSPGSFLRIVEQTRNLDIRSPCANEGLPMLTIDNDRLRMQGYVAKSQCNGRTQRDNPLNDIGSQLGTRIFVGQITQRLPRWRAARHEYGAQVLNLCLGVELWRRHAVGEQRVEEPEITRAKAERGGVPVHRRLCQQQVFCL